MNNLINDAIIFATEKHTGQFRKSTKLPYIVHPIECAAIMAQMTEDPELIAAAILHDTLEDTTATPDELKGKFGERVLSLVLSNTENKYREAPAEETWKQRKQETIDQIPNKTQEEQMLLLVDKLSNMRTNNAQWEIDGDKIWEKFNVKDKESHKWYYVSIARSLTKVKDTLAWREYSQLCQRIFGVTPYEMQEDIPKKWCRNQIICKEDQGKGTFTCLAHLAEGRAMQCPYKPKDGEDTIYVSCQDFERIE